MSLEEAVGQRTADTLMEKHKEQGRAGSLVSETIGITPAITFELQTAAPVSKIEAAYRKADHSLDQIVQLLAA